jgi:uncharacterized protein (DUF983 family)
MQPERRTMERPNLPTNVARMPIPGNAELALYVIALVVAWLVCWIADSLGSADWLHFFLWTTIAYIVSRGVAKASRVLEQ